MAKSLKSYRTDNPLDLNESSPFAEEFMCPICEFKTELKGLKDGTGSAHIINVHNLDFSTFLTLGLLWKKVTVVKLWTNKEDDGKDKN